MARKKPKLLRLRQIVDDDDGWVEYPMDIALQCGVLKKNPQRDGFIYVAGEEWHAAIESRLAKLGLAPRYTQYWVPSFRKWLKSDGWPDALAWRGGEWPEGSVWRNYNPEVK